MPNAWVLHVKKFAQEHNKSYGCAISDPLCKSTYVKQGTPVPEPVKVSFKKKRERAPPKILLIKDAPPQKEKVRRYRTENYERRAMAKNDTKPPPMQRINKSYSKMIKKAVGTGRLSKQELNSLGLD